MLKKEWPLVVFTILVQTAVGAFCALAVPFVFSKGPTSMFGFLYLNVWTLGGIAALVALAAAVSFFHLGSPFHAFNALRNMKSSWLSREIFLELIFLSLTALLAFLRWRGTTPAGIFKGLTVLAAVSGLALLYSMSRIYMLDTIPSWRSLYTPVSFLGTTVLLGTLTAAYAVRRIPIGMVLGGRGDNPAQASGGWTGDAVQIWRGFASFQHVAIIVGIAAVVAVVLAMFAFTPGVGVFAVKKVTLLEPPASKIWPAVVIRLVLLMAAAVLLIAVPPRGSISGAAVDKLLLAAFLSALAAETVGRFLFYFLYSRLGV